MSIKRIVWVEGAIVAALEMALSFIPHFMGWFSPSFGAIVLVVFALRRGLYPALFSGLVWGILHFVLGKVVYLSFSQVILEYIVAFGVMGVAGLHTLIVIIVVAILLLKYPKIYKEK